MSYERRIVALEVDEKQFTTTLALQELLELVIPGRAFLPKAKNDPVTERRVQDLSDYHDKVQRDLSGRKLSNAKGDLKEYLLDEWISSDDRGVLPPFLVWYPEQLETVHRPECGALLDVIVPSGAKGLLMDAESRVEAALYAVEQGSTDQVKALLGKRIGVTVFHGVPVETAAKYFADINGKGVGVTPNLSVSRDYSDPWATTAFDVFEKLGLEVEKEKRQVSQSSPAVITALQARAMVAAMVFGAGAVSFGAKKIPTTDPNSDSNRPVDFDKLATVAATWLGDVIEKLGDGEVLKDKELVVRSVPVLVSIGAIGRGYYTQDPNQLIEANRFLNDSTIDWTRGSHWDGVAGKTNPSTGRFSVGSGKENTWATLRALTDPGDAGYKQIRRAQDNE